MPLRISSKHIYITCLLEMQIFQEPQLPMPSAECAYLDLYFDVTLTGYVLATVTGRLIGHALLVSLGSYPQNEWTSG
jgi:hypothetical protein